METDRRQWEETGLRSAVLRGDQQAWRILYDRYFESLYAFIDYRTGHQRDLSEEVAQESWMVAVRRIRSFDPGRASFGSWLRGIAANVLRNRWRTNKQAEGIEEAKAVAANNPGSHPALAERIGLAMTTLPERYQAVLRAKYEEHLPLAEIANRWQESTKAVESLLSRARHAFREAYSRLDMEQ
ncbi:MAG: RNA polymerase sigma factor [Planctomycetota bacterium]|jgi:RNA polymerase sigma-70 factor (ECF subfamily)